MAMTTINATVLITSSLSEAAGAVFLHHSASSDQSIVVEWESRLFRAGLHSCPLTSFVIKPVTLLL
jgi:hypothetical protein